MAFGVRSQSKLTMEESYFQRNRTLLPNATLFLLFHHQLSEVSYQANSA